MPGSLVLTLSFSCWLRLCVHPGEEAKNKRLLGYAAGLASVAFATASSNSICVRAFSFTNVSALTLITKRKFGTRSIKRETLEVFRSHFAQFWDLVKVFYFCYAHLYQGHGRIGCDFIAEIAASDLPKLGCQCPLRGPLCNQDFPLSDLGFDLDCQRFLERRTDETHFSQANKNRTSMRFSQASLPKKPSLTTENSSPVILL